MKRVKHFWFSKIFKYLLCWDGAYQLLSTALISEDYLEISPSSANEFCFMASDFYRLVKSASFKHKHLQNLHPQKACLITVTLKKKLITCQILLFTFWFSNKEWRFLYLNFNFNKSESKDRKQKEFPSTHEILNNNIGLVFFALTVP